jgi:protein tyrosine phosphatase (PTP) superfamily phosphohydrolase (DUF442 family)
VINNLPKKLEEITNFLIINDHLATAGMPSATQLIAIAQAGYQVVINLALSDSPGALENEAQILMENGCTYVHIPVVWESPTLEKLDQFFQTMDKYKSKKVFVHCVMNMRVSIFVYLYRILRLNQSPEKATIQVLQIWQPDDVWENFIRNAITAHQQR